MALRDLLWSCPWCPGTSLTPVRRGDECHACGTLYRRGRGDEIIAHAPDGRVDRRRASDWLDLLKEEAHDGPHGPEPAVLRHGLPDPEPVRHDEELIGWIERFGERVPGRLTLANDVLRFEPDAGEAVVVAVEDLTSIQPSSRSLLLGRRGGEAIALEFPAASTRHWELRLQRAVKRRWAACGRGDVFAYQPRIAAR